MLGLVGRIILKVSGWKDVGHKPPFRKYVLIAAPHTSNWDLVFMLAIGKAAGIHPSWMGKHTMFRGLFGRMLRWLGGVPVDRTARRDVVQQMADAFAEADDLVLAIPPEGTRSLTKQWRSGFYHIARAANVPVVMGFLDYARKEGGIGPAVHLTGDPKADMDVLRAFYSEKKGRFPERFGPIRLAIEDEASVA